MGIVAVYSVCGDVNTELREPRARLFRRVASHARSYGLPYINAGDLSCEVKYLAQWIQVIAPSVACYDSQVCVRRDLDYYLLSPHLANAGTEAKCAAEVLVARHLSVTMRLEAELGRKLVIVAKHQCALLAARPRRAASRS